MVAAGLGILIREGNEKSGYRRKKPKADEKIDGLFPVGNLARGCFPALGEEIHINF